MLLCRKGFTFIELLVVFAIIAIVAGVVLSMSGRSDETIATSGARVVLQDLEYAQSEALARRGSVTVNFDVGQNQYTVSDDQGILTNPFSQQDFVVDLAYATGSSGARLVSADFGGGSSVVFTSNGEPVQSGGGDEPIAFGSSVVVGCRGATRAITISPVVGTILSAE
jgi:prepilin-type N-terminal cleavage/methylation domain-containing protein